LNEQKNSVRQISLEEFPSADNNIIALYRDKQNRIWIGTRGGLYVYTQDLFKKIVVDKNRENNSAVFEIRDIKQDEEGLIWIATEEYGIYSLKTDNEDISLTNHFQQGNSEILSNHIRKIFIDGNDLWLASLDGLSVFNKEGKSGSL